MSGETVSLYDDVEITNYNITGRIVNGTKATDSQFPHQVYITTELIYVYMYFVLAKENHWIKTLLQVGIIEAHLVRKSFLRRKCDQREICFNSRTLHVSVSSYVFL